jgi:hypothetical protein
MKIPKKVKLCGADFQIVFKRKLIDSDGNSLLGLCDVNNIEIIRFIKDNKITIS